MKVRGWLALVALGLAIALASCSRADPSIIAAGPDSTGGNTNTAGGPQTIDVAADATAIKYQQAQLSGPAGKAFSVKFDNPSALEHNWVLVAPGTENAVVSAAAGKNGDPTGAPGVIAGFAPIPKGSHTVEVPAQPEGQYAYLCTVPGHFAAGMHGTLTLGAAAANAVSEQEPASASPGGSAPAAADGGGELSVEGTTDLKFKPSTLEAPSGQAITVTFKNPSPLPHSWVLVKSGQEEAVDQAAATKGGDPTGIDGVIAASKVVNANASEQVSIPAQQPGTYTYICTVPGHLAAGMKGTLTVK